jgi:glucans biosynthesis protein
VFKVPATGAWRVMLKFEPKADNKDPIDLRCALALPKETQPLTETWTYYWNPP